MQLIKLSFVLFSILVSRICLGFYENNKFVKYNKEDALKFIGQNDSLLKKSGLKNYKDFKYYKKNWIPYSNNNFSGFKVHIDGSVKDFKSLATNTSETQHLQFYSTNRGHKKRLWFLGMAHINPLMGLKMFNRLCSRLKDFDCTYIVAFDIFRSEESLTADQAKKLFEAEFASHVLSSGKSENYLYVTCFSFLLTESFLQKNPGMFKKTAFYAPMVKNIIRGYQIDPSELYPKDTQWLYYRDLLTLLFISSDSFQGFLIPEKYEKINLATFSSFFDNYNSITEHPHVRNSLAILASNDAIVPRENSLSDTFDVVKVIYGADHITPFYVDAQLNELGSLVETYFNEK